MLLNICPLAVGFWTFWLSCPISRLASSHLINEAILNRTVWWEIFFDLPKWENHLGVGSGKRNALHGRTVDMDNLWIAAGLCKMLKVVERRWVKRSKSAVIHRFSTVSVEMNFRCLIGTLWLDPSVDTRTSNPTRCRWRHRSSRRQVQPRDQSTAHSWMQDRYWRLSSSLARQPKAFHRA